MKTKLFAVVLLAGAKQGGALATAEVLRKDVDQPEFKVRPASRWPAIHGSIR